MRKKSLRCALALAFTVLAFLAAGSVSTPVVSAQSFSPYSDFQAMTLAQLSTLQVKMTYLGIQTAGIPSIAFTSTSNTINLGAFTPFQRPGFSFANDGVLLRTFSATSQELKAVIDNVATLTNVTAGGVAASPYLSFSMVNSQPSTKGFEAVLNKADSAALFEQLRLALADNTDGSRKLSEMACPLDLSQVERPTDVSASAGVALSGVRLQRSTGRFVGTATVTNKSGSAFSAPVSLVLDLPGNVRLANADGTTCGTSPVGREFINIPSALGAGQSVDITVEFENPDRVKFTATTKVLAGPGAR